MDSKCPTAYNTSDNRKSKDYFSIRFKNLLFEDDSHTSIDKTPKKNFNKIENEEKIKNCTKEYL